MIKNAKIFEGENCRYGFFQSVFLLLHLPVLVLGWVMLPVSMKLLNFYNESQARRRLETAENAFIEFIGAKPARIVGHDAGHATEPVLTWTGLATDGVMLYVLDAAQPGMAVAIPPDIIRAWRWDVNGYTESMVVGGTISQAIAGGLVASQQNEKAKIVAAANSGIRIELADVDHPEVFFQSTDEKELKQWSEIIRQLSAGEYSCPSKDPATLAG